MIATSLADLCHVLDGAAAFRERILFLYHEPFTTEEKKLRKKILEREFCNEANAMRIIRKIWEE
jgi:hypothetical protein